MTESAKKLNINKTKKKKETHFNRYAGFGNIKKGKTDRNEFENMKLNVIRSVIPSHVVPSLFKE